MNSAALAISTGLPCPANISTAVFAQCVQVNGFAKLCLLRPHPVAPQWALASYSCISGKSEPNAGHQVGLDWSIRIGNGNDRLQQTIAVEQIIAYPQVSVSLMLASIRASILIYIR